MKKVFLMLTMILCIASIVQGLSKNSDIQQTGQGHFANNNQTTFDFDGLDNYLLTFDANWGTCTYPTWHGAGSTLGGFVQEYYYLEPFAYGMILNTEGLGDIQSGRDCSYLVYLWNWDTSAYEIVVNGTSGTIVNTSIAVADKYIFDNGTKIIKQWAGGDYKLGFCQTSLCESQIEYRLYSPCQSGICCRYDTKPSLKKQIDWSCSMFQFAQCVVGIFKDNELLSVSPDAKSVKDVGVVQYLDAKNGLLNFRLNTKDMYPKSNYTVRVFCHSNTTTAQYEGIIEPVYTDLREVPAFTLQIKENLAYVVFIFIILIAIIFIYSIITKR